MFCVPDTALSTSQGLFLLFNPHEVDTITVPVWEFVGRSNVVDQLSQGSYICCQRSKRLRYLINLKTASDYFH